MQKRGKLQVRYNIPLNDSMHDKICKTIEQDVRVQWLAATPLKRDQFKFLYEIQDIVYKCVIRQEFLTLPFDDLDKLYRDKVFIQVIPQLTVLKAMLRIRDIDDKKKMDVAHD